MIVVTISTLVISPVCGTAKPYVFYIQVYEAGMHILVDRVTPVFLVSKPSWSCLMQFLVLDLQDPTGFST